MTALPSPTGETLPADEPRWYCIRSQPKHEHIAAEQLRRSMGIEVFCPRVRIQKKTRTGLKWFVEALFPTYLFARFPLRENHARIRYSPGVSGILQFGDRFASVPDAAVAELVGFIGADEVKTVPLQLAEGDDVEIVSGPMQGQQGVITHLHTAQERVRILLDFLGQPREVEISLLSVFRQARVPGT
jgi:transcriptional antiterminator RfaH